MQRSLDHQLEVKRVETLYEQSYSALAANGLTAILFTVVLGLNGYTPVALVWLIAVFSVLAGRYLTFRRFGAEDMATLVPEVWFRRYGIGIAITGGLWGFIGSFATSSPSLALVFFAVAVLVGMVGGSVATCAVSVPIFLIFTFPTLLPASATLMLSGHSEKMTISVLILVYIGVVTRSVVQIKRVIVQSIFHRYENKRLLGELQREKQQIQASEAQLREAYDKLEATHGALVEQRSLVAEKTSEVKVLEGLLPICARCKMIRDDDGDWSQLEVYIAARSEAEFSHGLCPDCVERYRSQQYQASSV